MSNQITKLISLMSGSEKLEACLNISEINNVSDIMNLNEETIENIEKYIRKKCSQLPLEERKAFIDENMIHQPEKFMIPPGLSQRLINTCNNVNTIFKNIPPNEQNIAAISNNILKPSNSLSTISVQCLENVVGSDRNYQISKRLAIESALPDANEYPNTKLISYSSESTLNVPNNLENKSTPEKDMVDNDRLVHLNPPSIESGLIDIYTVDIYQTSTPKNSLFLKRKERSSSSVIQSLTKEFLPNTSFVEEHMQRKYRYTSNLIKQEHIDSNELSSFVTRSAGNIKFEPDFETVNPNSSQTDSHCKYSYSNIDSIRHTARRSDLRPRKKSRLNEIDYYYTKVVEDGDKLFENCNLVPKVDFDIELNVTTSTDRQRCAHFVCYRCHTAVRQMKKLKFYLTERGAVINSNIINHLKIHFTSRYN